MKKIFMIVIFFITPLAVFAQTYMAKVEPYEKFTLYSQSSGKIVKLDSSNETKTVTGVLIKLDTALEEAKLKLYKGQLELYNKKLSMLEENYNKYRKIKGKSKVEIDEKYYEIIDMKLNINNLMVNIKELEDTVNKKTIKVKNLYIKEFKANLGDYVSTGSELATVYDISRSKLEVFVSAEDHKGIRDKKLLINGKEGLGTIEKIDKTTDETFVSGYKVTILTHNKNFGEVLNLEFVK